MVSASASRSLRVFIPDGGFRHTLKVVRSLARGSLGPATSIHVSAGDPIPRALQLSRHVAEIHPISYELSGEDRMRAVASVARDIGADILFPLSITEGMLVARHRDLMDEHMSIVPLSDAATQELAGDKGRLARFMEAHDIPYPPAVSLKPVSTLRKRLEAVSFPVLVKTTIGEGGVHIFRFEEPDGVLEFARTKDDGWREYIVQSYIEGSDVDYSVLAVDGEVIAHTIQQAIVPGEGGEPFGPPSLIEFVHDPRVKAVGHRLIDALGYSGLAHVDLRYDENREALYVLEINTRIWGSLLGSLRAGINFPELACRVALDRPIPTVDYEDIRYSVGAPTLERVRKTVAQGIPLRQSCMAYGIDDPLPDLMNFVRLNLEWIKNVGSN